MSLTCKDALHIFAQVDALRLQNENATLVAEKNATELVCRRLAEQDSDTLLLRAKKILFEHNPALLAVPILKTMQVCLRQKQVLSGVGPKHGFCVLWGAVHQQDMDEAGIVFLPELLNSDCTESLLEDQWKSCSHGTSLAFILAWCIYNPHATFDCSSTARDNLWPRQDFQACCRFVEGLFKKVETALLGAFFHSATVYGDDIVASVSFFDNRLQLPVFWNSLGRILR